MKRSLLLGCTGLILTAVATPTILAAAEEPLVAVGLSAAPDGSAVSPGNVFPAGLKELSVGFRLKEDESFKKIQARWIAVDVGAAAPANSEMGKSSLNVKAMRSGRFRYTLPRALPVGKYEAVLTADDNPWKELPFSIAAQQSSATLAVPQDFFPLTTGREWVYDFVMEGREGTTVSLPGVVRSSDGKLRATAIYRVADVGPEGAHIEMLRNKEIVSEEWWRIDEKGFSVLKRKAGDDVVTFQPPQLLLPAGLQMQKDWDYKTGDTRQKLHAWGPVLLSGSQGSKPGYVVLIEEPANHPTASAERDIVPGMGIVNDVIITTLGGERLMKQQAILREIHEIK